jgi:GntR family transcriptional regulator
MSPSAASQDQRTSPRRAARIPLITKQDPAWEAVRRYIEEQIAGGVYAIDSFLPSVRDLAVELGINRNTVSKAYQALGRDGVLKAIHGRGVRVLRKGMNGHTSEGGVLDGIDALVRAAQFHGLSREWLLERVSKISDDVYAKATQRVAFVECNDGDTKSMGRDLTRHLGMEVQLVLLDDLASAPARTLKDVDLVATTFFHLGEVSEIVGQRHTEVVGINHVVSHETALAIARLKKGTVMAVVCPNDRTLDRVQKMVESFGRGPIHAYAGNDRAAIAKVLAGADVAVDAAMSHDVVKRERPDLETITVKFNIEPQSIEYLRDAIRRRAAAVPIRPRVQRERRARVARRSTAPAR